MTLMQKIQVRQAWVKIKPEPTEKILERAFKKKFLNKEFEVLMSMLEGIRLGYFTIELHGKEDFAYRLTDKGRTAKF